MTGRRAKTESDSWLDVLDRVLTEIDEDPQVEAEAWRNKETGESAVRLVVRPRGSFTESVAYLTEAEVTELGDKLMRWSVMVKGRRLGLTPEESISRFDANMTRRAER